jgi:hypothetical protein
VNSSDSAPLAVFFSPVPEGVAGELILYRGDVGNPRVRLSCEARQLMTEVAFITLFLGLTLGRRPVDLHVSGDVHRIELRLDGRRVALMKRPPWSTSVDFGERLIPRRLTAHALDAGGTELARAEQIINLPRPSAETRLVVTRDARATPRSVRILWQSVESKRPKSVHLTLDGAPIDTGSSPDIALPAVDQARPHLLRARVISPSGRISEAELLLSSDVQSESGASVSAIPVRLLSGSAMSIDDAKKWLTVDNQSVSVVAVDESGGDIMIVRHPNATAEIVQRVDPAGRVYTERRRASGDAQRFTQDNTLSILWPSAIRTKAEAPTDAFTRTELMTFSTIEHFKRDLMTLSGDAEGIARFADAVAAAGLEAISRRRPRAVVLILGRDQRDDSQFTPTQTREYLSSIGVPLFVWSLTGASDAWPDAVDVSSPLAFAKAYGALIADIRSQRIVWIEGDYLPAAARETTAGKAVMQTLAR